MDIRHTLIQNASHPTADWFQQSDVLFLARQLLGKILYTCIDGQETAARIVETEAYRAPDDRACHAYNNRRTPRTEVMFASGGHAYIYLCYGVHHLMNVVTGPENAAHAVLIRAGEPLMGVEAMLQRRKAQAVKPVLTKGPGAMSQALGIHTRYSGVLLYDVESPVQLLDDGFCYEEADVFTGPRVGVASSGDSAVWPWRFYTRSPYVSAYRP